LEEGELLVVEVEIGHRVLVEVLGLFEELVFVQGEEGVHGLLFVFDREVLPYFQVGFIGVHGVFAQEIAVQVVSPDVLFEV